jgi:DNA-directed RNA polymerase specialized sigma24 family protein
VFMLSHYEGCTSREVSALTGLNESTVRVHLFRAIRRLRTLLTDEGNARPAEITGGKRRVHS